MPAPLGAFQSNRLRPSVAARVYYQKAASSDADGTKGKRKLVGDSRPAVGPLKQAHDLVVFESGFEARYIQLVSVFDQRSLAVIFPS